MKLPVRIQINGENLTALGTAASALFNHPFDLEIPKAVLASKRLLDKKLAEGYLNKFISFKMYVRIFRNW